MGVDASSDTFAFVRSGIVNGVASHYDGREFILDVLSKGRFIGEFEVLRRCSSSLEFRSATDCTLDYYDGRHLRELCRRDEEFKERILRRALERVVELEERVVDKAYHSLPVRVAKVLLRLSRVYGSETGVDSDELAILQHDLAATLPASREKVNKALRRLREHAVVDIQHGVIRILDRNALRLHAESD
tara:strand:+ start:861 stop:1427 length:567 start_codon:yes stop_codon:yes gene_type:complete